MALNKVHLQILLCTLDTAPCVELFRANGDKQPFSMDFCGKTDTDRGEMQKYCVDVEPGGYWLIEPRDEQTLLVRVTALEGQAEAVRELTALVGERFEPGDREAFRDTCARLEVPDAARDAFLARRRDRRN